MQRSGAGGAGGPPVLQIPSRLRSCGLCLFIFFYKIVPMGEELLPLLPSRTRKRGLWVAVVIYILAAAVVCVIVTGNIRDSERDSVLAPIQSKTYFAVVQPKVKFIFERARLLYDVSLMIRTDQVLLCTIIFDSHGNKSRK